MKHLYQKNPIIRYLIKTVIVGCVAVLATSAVSAYELELTLRTDKGGQLEQKLGARKFFVEKVTVEGVLDDSDYRTMWECSFYGRLKSVDLTATAYSSTDGNGASELSPNAWVPAYAFYDSEVQGKPWEDGFKTVRLEEFRLPASCNVIGDYAFFGTPLKEFTLQRGSVAYMERIGERAFEYTRLTEIGPFSAYVVGDYAFAHSQLEEAHPKLITHMGTGVFEGCGRLKVMTLPSEIGMSARMAYGCDLEEIRTDLEFNLGEEALAMNPRLKFVNLEKCQVVSAFAFKGCDVETVVLDNPLLMTNSFADLPALRTIYSPRPTPPRAYMKEDNYRTGEVTRYEQFYPFGGTTPRDVTVYVPIGASDTYRNTEGWNYFTNFVETSDFPFSGVKTVETETGGGLCASGTAGGIIIGSRSSDAGNFGVYDLSGRMLSSGTLNPGETSRLDCAPGIYLVRLGSSSLKVAVK